MRGERKRENNAESESSERGRLARPNLAYRRRPPLLPNMDAAILTNQLRFPGALDAGWLASKGSSLPCPVGFICPVRWS